MATKKLSAVKLTNLDKDYSEKKEKNEPRGILGHSFSHKFPW